MPDPRLGVRATFTLAEDLGPTDDVVRVLESTHGMSTVVGTRVRNSVTLRIGDELITYTGLAGAGPGRFTGCERGAHATTSTRHPRGARVEHLRECYGMFVPAAGSSLLDEVAARTAELVNRAGFDLLYLDALDTADTLADRQTAWHHAARFAYAVARRLERPVSIEMSTMSHNLWVVRSRLEAWDHPARSHKRFVDLHLRANADAEQTLLPAQLGWWRLIAWEGTTAERTFPDDLEYLLGRALAIDAGISIGGVGPQTFQKTPAFGELAGLIRRYEELRLGRYFDDGVRAALRRPGEEHTLARDATGEWFFRRVHHTRHRVTRRQPSSGSWTVDHRFEEQSPVLRIEGLLAAGAYDAGNSRAFADPSDPTQFGDASAARDVTVRIDRPIEHEGRRAGLLQATNAGPSMEGVWSRVAQRFAPPLDLGATPAAGVWVHGDGQGQLLNVQWRSPRPLSPALADHYIPIDFTGWRYFELVEPEAGYLSRYRWPYGGRYAVYRQNVRPSSIAELSLYLAGIPAGRTVGARIGPIRALPVVESRLRDPAIEIDGRRLVFPVTIASGQVLEFRSIEDCRLYGQRGELVRRVRPKGVVPVLQRGPNRVSFDWKPVGRRAARVAVTVMTHGPELRGRRGPTGSR